MPSYLYRTPNAAEGKYQRLRTVRLAGRNAIKKGWDEHQRPIEQGWNLDRSDLVRLAGGNPDYHTILIDLKPSAKHTIDIYELQDIIAFTHGNTESGTASWTPLMLRLREVWCENVGSQQAEWRSAAIQCFPSEQQRHNGDIFEFLYLQANWNWGPIGIVNGALLYSGARAYFMEQMRRFDG